MSDEHIVEAQRQLTVCNACRYCEGFCSVFPALQRERTYSLGSVTQLSNLCHNCRACHYACQYSSPHEFKINIPQALSNVRVESWERHSKPQVFSKAFQRHGSLICLSLVMAISLFFILVSQNPASDVGFYAFISHNVMVLVFAPAFTLPLLITALALRSYWHEIQGRRVQFSHIKQAFSQAFTLRNLSGGQGQGCNFENEDRYSNSRRYLHQATVLGFLLCFSSTASGTVMHYFLNWPAPYAWYTAPKLLGVPGGVLLTIGCAGLAYLKCRADRSLSTQSIWGAEMAFVLLLGSTGLTGLILYAATGTSFVSPALAVHLACVLVLFILIPYSKMIHGFFRMAALVREAQLSNTQS